MCLCLKVIPNHDKSLLMPYANNVSADQHMHPRYTHLVYLILHKRVTFANRLHLSL